MNVSGFSNCSVEDINCHKNKMAEQITYSLEYLNSQHFQEIVPVIIYIGTLMFIGTIGNTLTLYVYNWLFKRQSSTVFITSIAVFDLLGCLIAMPLEIFDLSFKYTFYNSSGCKAIHFFRNITIFGSAILLVEIAFDRYFKICKPWRLLKLSTVKWMCIITGGVAVLLSVPALILFGISRTPTPVNGTVGYDCAFEEHLKGSLFQQIYFFMLALLFIVTFSFLAGFYARIWHEIRKRRQAVIRNKRQSSEPATARRSREITQQKAGERDSTYNNNNGGRSSENSSIVKSSSLRRKTVGRTTVIFAAVSGAFVFSFLPALCFLIWKSFQENTDNFSMVEEIVVRLYMINNVINPIFYGFLNPQFRERCCDFIYKITNCCAKEVKHTRKAVTTGSQGGAQTYV